MNFRCEIQHLLESRFITFCCEKMQHLIDTFFLDTSSNRDNVTTHNKLSVITVAHSKHPDLLVSQFACNSASCTLNAGSVVAAMHKPSTEHYWICMQRLMHVGAIRVKYSHDDIIG